ncbi:PMU3 [Candida pseudojiufengensis]|uniref:PMU3 n=1 Tax=Candida pseudojiufengensis TaxID=497109 RepID=UPI0022242417|nr:PMU3 [Candida pseudojiufengensis]KAI5966950.1 PMU3 [Candida pseudojiufengensis]
MSENSSTLHLIIQIPNMSKSPNQLDILDSQIDHESREKYLKKLQSYQNKSETYWDFTIVPNIFQQSQQETDDSNFNYLDENFGKIGEWDDIVFKLQELNNQAKSNECYKILFLFRHYTGFHNLAHLKYGDDAWNDYWSKLNGDDEYTWGPDANLTPESIELAKKNSKLIEKELRNNPKHDLNLILPKKFYVSPLSRAIDTLYYTWNGINDLKNNSPLIQENWRETTGVHTCDKRSTRSIIEDRFSSKGFKIEDSLTENDELYKDDYRETIDEQAFRMYTGLQEMFNNILKNDDIVSITSHSGSIRTQLLVLGHRPFAVQTGGMIPVFVKAVKQTRNSSRI